MAKFVNILAVSALALGVGSQALAQQPPQSFILQKGQAIRVAPDGKVDVIAKMPGDESHIAKIKKRSRVIRKGMAIWVGEDGRLRYLTSPIEATERPPR